jgi:predicted exporter
MQSLSPTLVAEQERIQTLLGATGAGQFFLIQAPDAETALRREEALADRLQELVQSQALGGFQSAAQFVPSAARQQENRQLIDRLEADQFAAQVKALGLADAPLAAETEGPPLTLIDAMRPGGPLPFLSLLVLPGNGGGATHVVTLDHVNRPDQVAQAADLLDGVHFVDPAGDFSRLLGKYRARALALLALSALLMMPVLGWRSLMGAGFTFFDAMALVLVLSVGVDYAVFFVESQGDRRPVTALAVAMAACTALMSFGMLALSRVSAVHAFGTTMLIGIFLAFIFAPLAREG